MQHKRVLYVSLLLIIVLMGSACNARIIRGSGDLVTETREVSGYDSIVLTGSGTVEIIQNGNESLTIETDDNVMDHIEVKVTQGELRIGFEQGINIISTTRLIFTVEVDELSSVSISGSGDIASEAVDSDRFEAEISGSGDVQIVGLSADRVRAAISGSGEVDLAGSADSQNVAISGSGKYRAGDLCSDTVEVSISGSGSATVCATDSLNTDISGSGSVSYYGQPAVNSSGSGSGNVKSLGTK